MFQLLLDPYSALPIWQNELELFLIGKMVHTFTVLLDHGIYKELDPKFRLDYCKLWKALISLDVQKILELGEQFGVGKYAKYFPLIFTGRTIDR